MTARLTQWLFLTLGVACVLLAIIGFFVPGLPWFPFALGASYCFARSSERFHRALHSNRWFGPALHSWEESKSIPRSAKAVAVPTILLSFVVTIYFAPLWWVKVVLAALGAGIILFILTRSEPTP